MYSLYFANAKVVKIKCLVVIHLEKGHNLRLRAAFLNSAQNVSSFFLHSQAIREVRVFLVIIHLWTDSKAARRTYQAQNTQMFRNFVLLKWVFFAYVTTLT